MGRKRIPGLRNRNGIWHIEKQVLGTTIHESTGTSDLNQAELILARRIEEIRQSKIFGMRRSWTFREAAARYLEENLHLASIRQYARCLSDMDSYIGALPLQQVHLGTLKPFMEWKREQGVKNRTINMYLGAVRRILNLSARLWRDDNGLTWLESAPLIQMLPLTDARKPYPLSWDEQQRLFQALPAHLVRMCLFKVNTGCREQEVCNLRWEPVTKINNSAWKRARAKVGLWQVRVHDLKHTLGRRLRAAGVPVETRKVLLGRRNGDITTHYSAPELEELFNAANTVCQKKSGKTPALVVLKTRMANA